jgi:hypothetical protein
MILAAASKPGVSLAFIEGCLTLIAVAIAFALPRLGSVWFSAVERSFAQLARRRRLAVLLVGATAFLLRLALLPLSPIPQPFTPDDFSFLLSADTFASGRLANPTPAMWTHFESIHITMIPTYASMYFPAQGLLLAAGKVLTGEPWFGLLCVTALMCAAICWMLQAWLPPGWALLGGMLAVLRLGLFSYWINTYTGGASVAALGGALVLGAFPRLTRTTQLRHGLLLAAGISILLISRPYEGLLLCLPVAVALARWSLTGKRRPSPQLLLRRAAVPLALIVAVGAWMAYYDFKAFGNPFTPPYTLNRAQYAIEQYWMWQPPKPEPAYRHKVMQNFYVKAELPVVTEYRTPIGFVKQSLFKPFHTLEFFTFIALLPPLFMLRRVLLDKRTRFLVLCIAVLTAGMFFELVLLPHYLAPFSAAFYAIGLQCMRHLRLWHPEAKPVGAAMVRFIVLTCIAMALMRAWAGSLHLALSNWPPSEWTANWYGSDQLGARRAAVDNTLKKLPGRQLAIVRYAPDHDPVWEWVYNDANISDSKVIWAREMDAVHNAELIEFYNDRKIWLVKPDSDLPKITPYPSLELSAPTAQSGREAR